MGERLVIFDCDGVLVDSETLSAQVMRGMAHELGVYFDHAAALGFLRGRKVAEWVSELGEMAGRTIPDDFIPDFRHRCAAAFDRDLAAVDGVADVLGELEIPFCCASSSPEEHIRHVLSRTGLLRFFPEGRVFSAYELGVWKPDPGLFLHAAGALGTEPERCAVVEDSTPGVRAGLRAGMTVFGYAPGSVPAFMRRDAVPFASMRDLPSLLRHWHGSSPEYVETVTP